MTTSSDAAQPAEQSYQAESIRLAELRLHQLHDSITAIEKKAVPLITGCAALLGIILLSFKIQPTENAGTILPAIVEFLRHAAFFWARKSLMSTRQ